MPAPLAGFVLLSEPQPRQRALRRHDRGQQQRIRLGGPRLKAEHQQPRRHRPGQKGRARPHQRPRRPGGQQHRQHPAQQRRQAIGPDRRLRPAAEQLRGGRLRPVDADRLLVTRVVLEPDIDVIAADDHLLGGLREARLVAIGRIEGRQARRHQRQRDERQQEGLPPGGAAAPADHPAEGRLREAAEHPPAGARSRFRAAGRHARSLRPVPYPAR